MNLIIEYKEDDKEVYKLPFTYLNYLSQEVADEFILEDGKAKIIRRVGINSSMQKYELPNEVLEELGDFTIPLKEGNPKIYLQCFDSAIYNATYMIKNAYTEEFATKVELSSSITQTSEEINLSVDKKIQDLDTQLSSDITQTSNSIIAEVNGKISELDEDINAKLELKVDTENLVSELNASADVINLTSNRFSMISDNSSISQDGTFNFKGGTIGGWTVNNEGFTNGDVFVKSNGYSSIYTYADMVIIRNYLLNKLSLDDNDISHYDLNGDGVVDSTDLLIMRQKILGIQ